MKKLIIVLTVVMMAALLFTGCFKVNNPPVVTTISLPNGTIGTAYTTTVTATDEDGDTLTFTLVSGPTDMVISSAGVISGWTPSVAGAFDVTVTVTDGKDPVTATYIITVLVLPVGPTETTIDVKGEYPDTATGKTYVQGGSREITVTFPGPIKDIPKVRIGEEEVPMFTLDNIVWKGNGHFPGDCDAVLITVRGVCEEDICAAKSVVVDSGKPYAKLKAKVAKCECETGYALTITSDWSVATDCEDLTGCCGDDCVGLASWNIKIFHENPWHEACCEPDPCIEPNAEADGTECPITITKECIDAVYVPDGDGGHWVDFFDSSYWVIATLTDKVGNEIKYYGEVINDRCEDELAHFVELYIDPTSEDCWCYAEDPAVADLVIGDCDGTPTTECWEEPLDPCPEVTVKPAKPIVGQPANITIDYTDAVKPTGKVSAYVGPAFKDLPLGIPEGSSELPLEKISDYVYVANVVFGEAGDRIIYVVDACADCTPCTYNITVLPADVCPIVKFLEFTWWEEVDGKGVTFGEGFAFGEYDIPGYGLTNVDFTVTFANKIEKELVKVYVGIPGLGPIFMPIPMPPTALQVAMTTLDEVTYFGTIPIGDLKEVVVGVINHMSGAVPGDLNWVDPDQPFQTLPSDIQYLIHTLGCIPLRIYVLAGDPCCIEVCEYPFLVDPIGPFANLEVRLEECCIPCATPGCDPCEYPGHEIIISVDTPGLCTLEECCNDTCSGMKDWYFALCPCYNTLELNDTSMPQGPFDVCCDFIGCVQPDCFYWMYAEGTDCPEVLVSDCIHDWADPYGDNPVINDTDLSDIWTSTWYLYLRMTDKSGNTTEYKAKMGFEYERFDTGHCWTVECDTGDYWTINIINVVPLCDDAAWDFVFGADFCVGPHF